MSGPGRFGGGGHDAAKPNRWQSVGPMSLAIRYGEPEKPIRPYECTHCGRKFRNKFAMELHVKELHDAD
jgi:hypothetical protein